MNSIYLRLGPPNVANLFPYICRGSRVKSLPTGASVKFNKLCIIGLGYIGLPTASTFAMHGLDVVGVDINPQVVESLNRGESHINNEPGLAEAFSKAVQAGKFRAALQPESADAYLIAVPTPFKENETCEFN